MKEKTKLIVGISLPLVTILIVAVLSFAPRFLFHPKYDFIYTVDSACNNDYYSGCGGGSQWSSYVVVDGKITKVTDQTKIPQKALIVNTPKEIPNIIYPKLYRYHMESGTFEEISFDDAEKLTLLNGAAPDGTVIVNGANNGEGIFDFFFGGYRSDQNELYLKKGSGSKKIVVQNVGQSRYSYNSNFHLVGWVK